MIHPVKLSFIILFWFTVTIIFGTGCSNTTPKPYERDMSDTNRELATFGAGCFWCVEAVFQQLEGVYNVHSGYSGGVAEDATYRLVSSGKTGHAEVVQLEYDPVVIPYDKLLEVFFKTHDPTTLNRQGADVGPQYRSVIFFHNAHQKERAQTVKQKLDEAGIFNNPIVTTIEQFKTFYKAEDYHQNYFKNNPEAAYCQFVIVPKLDKMEKLFEDLLRE